MEAALDGDSDRKTILGQNAFFVMPYDSLVVLANNLEHLPWFKANGQEGQGGRGEVYAMFTSGVMDMVTKKRGLECLARKFLSPDLTT